MKRKQIYIEEEQERRLKQLASDRGVSEAEIIRDALSEYLAVPFPKFSRPEDNPLWGIVGLIDDPDVPVDGSLNHDHYIYGGPKKYRILDDGTVERIR